VSIREAAEAVEANELICEGWELLSIKEKNKSIVDPATGLPVNKTSIIYIMGKRASNPIGFQTATDFVVTSDHLEQLPWKNFKSGAPGQWVFAKAEKYREPALTLDQLKIHAWLITKLPNDRSKFEADTSVYQRSGDFVTRKVKR